MGNETELTVEQTQEALASMYDPKKQQDYIGKLAVPLANAEKVSGAFFKYMIEFVLMLIMRMKNSFMVIPITFMDRKNYSELKTELDAQQVEAMTEARRRMTEGQDNWMDKMLLKEESMTPAEFNAIFAALKKRTVKTDTTTTDDDQTLVKDVIDSQSVLPPSEEETDELDETQQSMAKIDPFGSTEEVDRKIDTFNNGKNDEMKALLLQMQEEQKEVASMLEEIKAEKEQENQIALDQAERERRENSFFRNKLGLVSGVFRKFDVVGRGFNWAGTALTGQVTKYHISQHILDWVGKIPMDKIFDFTTFREKIDSLIFHRLGLHQGSYIYNMGNTMLGKIWFILEPLIRYMNVIIVKVTAMQKWLFEKVGTALVEYGGGTVNLLMFLYNWYVKIAYNAAAYILSILLGIYFWYVLLMIKLIRFILNLVLSRFGISI